jgi:serpin B
MDNVVDSNTSFAISLYQKLKESGENIFFSPYCISIALSMTFAGSRGQTEKQMAEILGFISRQGELHRSFCELENHLQVIQDSGDVQLIIANSLWLDQSYPLLTEYLALLKQYYDVVLTYVNYGQPETARAIINAWVDDKTKGKIKDLISKGIITPITRLVITNAIYFKGSWLSQFDEEKTELMPFWILPEEKINVATMTQKREYGYSETADMQILEIPYQGDDITLIMLLPKDIDGLVKIEETLCVETLDQWIHNLQSREVEVFLPKFKLQSVFRLDDVLESMGMTDAFDAEKANFSGMDGIARLFITAVLHKAYIEVNEEGTEATAATAVIMGLKGFPPPPIVFRANHPYLFLIREKTTGSILFLGRMLNPEYAVKNNQTRMSAS